MGKKKTLRVPLAPPAWNHFYAAIKTLRAADDEFERLEDDIDAEEFMDVRRARAALHRAIALLVEIG